MKLIIAGTRTITDREWIFKVLDNMAIKPDEVISGHANGADRIGELWANARGIKLTCFPADWNQYGKSAGYRRNLEMAAHGTDLIAFWDGKSRGTKSVSPCQTARR